MQNLIKGSNFGRLYITQKTKKPAQEGKKKEKKKRDCIKVKKISILSIPMSVLLFHFVKA